MLQRAAVRGARGGRGAGGRPAPATGEPRLPVAQSGEPAVKGQDPGETGLGVPAASAQPLRLIGKPNTR